MSHHKKSIYMLGYASALGGANSGSAKGPVVIQESPCCSSLTDKGIQLAWEKIVQPTASYDSVLSEVTRLCGELAESTAQLTIEKKPFVVLAGDHTSAIGTWSGVAFGKRKEGGIGLIWIDAHLDSHTPDTSPTGNLHGMPVACLLGHGEKSLTGLLDHSPKVRPENMCIIGARSYEKGEYDLLTALNVKIFSMDEVKSRGMTAILAEAIGIVTRNTVGYGMSIDIDSMDPHDAPGTGVAEPNGIAADDLCAALVGLAKDPRFSGLEIAEFDPSRDIKHKTEKLVIKLISAIYDRLS
ncbi:MAG TPA: arginase [Gammaproteobacteria bacterium]|nr:arginase [Gammaproteobacteria bacterium]